MVAAAQDPKIAAVMVQVLCQWHCKRRPIVRQNGGYFSKQPPLYSEICGVPQQGRSLI